jgi:hypothetical protein
MTGITEMTITILRWCFLIIPYAEENAKKRISGGKKSCQKEKESKKNLEKNKQKDQ